MKKDESMKNNTPFPAKTIIAISLLIISAIVLISLGSNILETVERGTFHIIQRPFTGTIEAKMVPGTYWQMFSDVSVWPVSETYYFTDDSQEGASRDQSIEVRFNDGALCQMSGTCRILLPTDEDQAKALVTKLGYKKYEDLEAKLITPTLRNALRSSANLMTSRESYGEKRPSFLEWSWDQINEGLYKTDQVEKQVKDPITGLETTKIVQEICMLDGKPCRQEISPIRNTGITLANFEVKQFKYPPEVVTQIATQQESYMGIATAKAKADRAEQEARTAEMEGKKNVMEAQYIKEVTKKEATVEAEKEKEVATIKAEQEKSVAEIEKEQAMIVATQKFEVAQKMAETAEQEKKAAISKGEGEAKAKQLILEADGALQQKLETWKEAQMYWAEAFAKRSVPSFYIAGSGSSENGSSNGPDDQLQSFMTLMNANAMKQLSLDMSIIPPNRVQTKQVAPTPLPPSN
jgi:regulator of protease activity HflC (stomatin/prohibitin superfamily)